MEPLEMGNSTFYFIDIERKFDELLEHLSTDDRMLIHKELSKYKGPGVYYTDVFLTDSMGTHTRITKVEDKVLREFRSMSAYFIYHKHRYGY